MRILLIIKAFIYLNANIHFIKAFIYINENITSYKGVYILH